MAHQHQADRGVGVEARAQRVLAEYLRCWGLRDPMVIATHCRRWVRQAAFGESVPSLCRAAVELAMNDIDRWIDHLAHLVAADEACIESTRGLVAVEVQARIDKYPAALLSYDTLPPAFVEHLRRAARCVVPPSRNGRMQAQPLGELAPVFRWSCWARAAGRAAAIALGLVSLRWLKRAEA